MRGPRLIHLWGPLSHCYEEKWKSAIQFKLSRKWLCGRSISTVNKKFWIITRVPHETTLVAAFDAKEFNGTELLKSYLAGGNRTINFCRQTNRKYHGWMFHTTLGLRFYKFHIWFFLSVLKNTNNLHMCGGIKTLKHNVWTTLRLAYHRRKNLTQWHTRTKHVK